jgi:hypothetical protein
MPGGSVYARGAYRVYVPFRANAAIEPKTLWRHRRRLLRSQ